MDRIKSIIGFDLVEGRWIAYCIHYDLEAQDATIQRSWEVLIELCESYMDWCLAYGISEIVTPKDDAPLRKQQPRQTHVYDRKVIAEGIAENEGHLLLDSVPEDWTIKPRE
jgi:hypothetical protein